MITASIEDLQAEIERLKSELAQAKSVSQAGDRPGNVDDPDTLGSSRDKYQRLLDTIDEGFCIIQMKFDEHGRGIDYKFIETNRAFEAHTGLVNAQGKWVRDLIPEHDQHWFDIYSKVAKTGKSARYEDKAEALGRWFEVHATAVDHPGDLVAVLFNDTSARRSAEKALRDSEQYWRGVFEKLEDGFISGELVRDGAGNVIDWKYLDVNPAWGLKVGIEPRYAKGKTIRTLFPEIEEFWISEPANAVRTRRSAAFSHEVGKVGRWYEGRVHPLGDDRFTIIFQDVTDSRSAAARRQALLEFGDELRVLSDPGEIATMATCTVARALKVDGARYLAVDNDLPTNILGEYWLSRPDHHDYDAVLRAIQVSKPFAITAPHPGDDVPARLSILSVPLTESGVTVAALCALSSAPRSWKQSELRFVRDVAERASTAMARRKAESDLRDLNAALEQTVLDRTEELLRSEDQLRQSQKMEVVGQLTGGIAHDFNNLLTGISGSLEMLQSRIAQGRTAELDKYILAAHGAARRAASLTHRLLAFSRRQTLDPKPTDVCRLVCLMEDLIVRTVGPAVAMQIRSSVDIWSTYVDANQLENALLNLCINARDAMPDGGNLTVAFENTTLDARAASAFDVPPGSYVQLSVSDTGTGMSADVASRAFEPFFTTKPIGMGTGLGLSMIYGFIRQSGGHARIYSEVGQGTTVRLYLPRHVGAEVEVESMQMGQMPRAQDGETVLVVDDEPTVRLLVTEILQELGYHAIEAADGPSGLVILESKARIDLLVSDVGLPGNMNGRQMADLARMTRPDLKVLFITGYAEQAVIGNGDLSPGMHIMTKPFSIEGLAVRIKSLIEQD